jgi:hypothetical protein
MRTSRGASPGCGAVTSQGSTTLPPTTAHLSLSGPGRELELYCSFIVIIVQSLLQVNFLLLCVALMRDFGVCHAKFFGVKFLCTFHVFWIIFFFRILSTFTHEKFSTWNISRYFINILQGR